MYLGLILAELDESKSTLELPKDVDEEAVAIPVEVSKVVRELREVIPHADFSILAHMTVNPQKRAILLIIS